MTSACALHALSSTIFGSSKLAWYHRCLGLDPLNAAGPIRFVVNEDDLVAGVMDTASSPMLEGRLPFLGSDVKDFLLYCANAGSDSGSGSHGGRNFVPSKKQRAVQNVAERKPEMTAPKGSVSSWKAWLNKSFPFKISSH